MIVLDIIVSRDEIKEYEKLKLISELALIKQHLSLFESKYNCHFQEFEENLKRESQDNFKEWDDYIEWKAYWEREKVLAAKMDQIAHVQDIKIVEDA